MAVGKNAKKPWVSNYPELDQWLKKHHGACMWQAALGSADNPHSYVEGWQFPRGVVLVIVVHGNQNGWDVFTPAGTLETVDVLIDAERRLGLCDASQA